jgi:choice-of-anchor A domain-containing protein
MKTLFASTSFALVCLVAPAGAAALNALDMMQRFTNIVLTDLNAAAETEGTVFVGGNYDGGANVNPQGLAPIDFGDGLSGTLFVGGDINGAVSVNNGDAQVGGSVTGSAVMNGGTLYTGVAGIPVAEMTTAMTGLSSSLSLLSDTGGVAALSDQNQLSFSSVADANNFAVFNVGASWMATGTFLGVTADPGVTTIINVSGTSVNIGVNANQSLTNVVFNFFEAQNISLNSAFNYSILAPLAHLSHQGGGVNGTMVTKSLQQNAEIRPLAGVNFSGNLPGALSADVPLPAAAPMLLIGLAGLGAVAASRQRRAA